MSSKNGLHIGNNRDILQGFLTSFEGKVSWVTGDLITTASGNQIT